MKRLKQITWGQSGSLSAVAYNMALNLVVAVGLFIVISPFQMIYAADYDLVILNGRVMDPESGLDATRNVGIKDGKIAAISKDKISGKQQIDASGHVVAPGFVDGHSHVVDQPLREEKGTEGFLFIPSVPFFL